MGLGYAPPPQFFQPDRKYNRNMRLIGAESNSVADTSNVCTVVLGSKACSMAKLQGYSF